MGKTSRQNRGRNIRFDVSGIDSLADGLAELRNSNKIDAFLNKGIKTLGGNLEAHLVENTPVGVYGPKVVDFTTKDGKHVRFNANIKKTGGTLKRGWGVDGVVKTDKGYRITIANKISYASYVNYGHRTADHKGYVDGQLFMEEGIKEYKADNPERLLENELTKMIEGAMNGKA